MKDTSPYAELAQRNSVLSAGLRKSSKHSPQSPARPTYNSEETRSTVATVMDYPVPFAFVSSGLSRESLRGRSRSSSCEGPRSPERRKGKGRALPVRRDQEADLHFTHLHEVLASPGSSRNGGGSFRHGDGSASASFWSSFADGEPEAAEPSIANQLDQNSRDTSPVPAVQCGTPEGNSVSPPPPQERLERQSSATTAGLKKGDLMKEQLEHLDAISHTIFKNYPLLGGLERLGTEEPAKPERARKYKGRSSDSRTEELSTRIPSDASETSSSHSRGTSFSIGSPRKSRGLASGLSENNPLLGGLEWDNKPDDAQLELLDRVLGATAAQSQEVGPPLLPANFMGRESGTSLHTSLSAVQPSSCSPQRRRPGSLNSIHGPLMAPSSVVQAMSSKTGRMEQATILLVDHMKGTYKIRTLDGHTETVKANCVSPVAPGTS